MKDISSMKISGGESFFREYSDLSSHTLCCSAVGVNKAQLLFWKTLAAETLENGANSSLFRKFSSEGLRLSVPH